MRDASHWVGWDARCDLVIIAREVLKALVVVWLVWDWFVGLVCGWAGRLRQDWEQCLVWWWGLE